MRYEIGKSFKFEAAHHLAFHDGKCARRHGHSYRFELIVGSDYLIEDGPQQGMVLDYAEIDAVGKAICQKFDHYDLNEVLGIDTTTAEILSRIIWSEAIKALPDLIEVRVKETESTFASFKGGNRWAG